MSNIVEPHVFFVDDDPALRKVVAIILRGVGIKVDCFDNPATCLAKLRSQRCNLLITDLKMPEMDGIELLEEVKGITPSVPILVMSAYGDTPMTVEAMKTGAVDFIEKPFEKKSLIHKVKSLLQESTPRNSPK